MQLKNRFIANAGDTMLLVITSVKAANIAIKVSDLWA
jgi:hypothetical protein